MKYNLAAEYKTRVSDQFHLRLVCYLNRLSLMLEKGVIYEHHPGDNRHYCGVWVVHFDNCKYCYECSWNNDRVVMEVTLANYASELSETGFKGIGGLLSNDLLEEIEQFISDYAEATDFKEERSCLSV